MTATTMTTQFKNMNYCSAPSIDVPIIPKDEQVHHCKTCGGVVTAVQTFYVIDGRSYPKDWDWSHVEEPAEKHWLDVKPTCHYCGSDEATKFKQMNWSDETHCGRCGGVYGFPIGD